ncbi:MAG: hypothetical protein O3A63_05945 [Proteobacteria bacterium]|nr:hypothetical protein [Pseudomonadota bacterium]
MTPDLHRVHHSAHRPETDSNFSAVFPIIDLIFGTFRTRTEVEAQRMRLGLNEVDSTQARRFGWLLLSPFVTIPTAAATAPDAGAKLVEPA